MDKEAQQTFEREVAAQIGGLVLANIRLGLEIQSMRTAPAPTQDHPTEEGR